MALTRTLELEQLGGSREENWEAKGAVSHPPTLAEMLEDSMILTETWFSRLQNGITLATRLHDVVRICENSGCCSI